MKRYDVVYEKRKTFGFAVYANNEAEAAVVGENLKNRHKYTFDEEAYSDWDHDAITTLHSVTEGAK